MNSEQLVQLIIDQDKNYQQPINITEGQSRQIRGSNVELVINQIITTIHPTAKIMSNKIELKNPFSCTIDVDLTYNINNRLVFGECKGYMDWTMLRRTWKDYELLKENYNDLIYFIVMEELAFSEETYLYLLKDLKIPCFVFCDWNKFGKRQSYKNRRQIGNFYDTRLVSLFISFIEGKLK